MMFVRHFEPRDVSKLFELSLSRCLGFPPAVQAVALGAMAVVLKQRPDFQPDYSLLLNKISNIPKETSVSIPLQCFFPSDISTERKKCW